MEVDPLRREAGAESGVQFPGGYHVHAHAFLRHDAVHLLKGRRLAGVQWQRAGAEMVTERLQIHPAVGPDARLVHQVEGGAVLLGQLGHVISGEGQDSLRRPIDVVGKHLDSSLVGNRRCPAVHIFMV